MAKRLVIIGTPGAGQGDPAPTCFSKHNSNVTELYNQLGANADGELPPAIPVNKGGTGATTAANARANLGLGSAAVKEALSNNLQAKLLSVGDYGLGGTIAGITITSASIGTAETQLASWYDTWNAIHFKNFDYNSLNKPNWSQILVGRNATKGVMIRSAYNGAEEQYTLYGTHNAIKDSNGFLKGSSPIVQLYADQIKLNDDAKLQSIIFEKIDVGDYLIKGSLGFAQEGWYIETPKDANGNVLFSVAYEQLENNDISVKTYKKKFDIESASVIADLDHPVDIPVGRWIDLRLHEEPQPEPEIPITPPEFQPTNLAQAVAEAFNNGVEQ